MSVSWKVASEAGGRVTSTPHRSTGKRIFNLSNRPLRRAKSSFAGMKT
jgi:hypothetical protein